MLKYLLFSCTYDNYRYHFIILPYSMEDQYCFEVTVNGGNKLTHGYRDIVATKENFYGRHDFEVGNCKLWIIEAKVISKLLKFPPL